MTNEERKERNLESWINARATLGETREEAIAKWHKQEAELAEKRDLRKTMLGEAEEPRTRTLLGCCFEN